MGAPRLFGWRISGRAGIPPHEYTQLHGSSGGRMYLLLRRPCLWLAAALLLVTCGDQSATPLAASKPAPSFTTGQPALGALPDMAQPLRAVFTNSLLLFLPITRPMPHLRPSRSVLRTDGPP